MSDTTAAEVPEMLDDVFLGWDTLETCDGCGPAVSALWLVFIPPGSLTLCGSHYRKYSKKINPEDK